MKFRRGLGIILFFVGVFLLTSSQSGMTGDVVSEKASALSSIFGLVFIVGGLVLMLTGLERRIEKLKKELKETLDSGRIGTYDELRKIAVKMGYRIEEGANHTKVYNEGNGLITQIPRHPRGIATGTYRGIAKALLEAA